MIVNFKEQVIDNLLIPSFTLTKGEIVVILLPSGPFFYPLSQEIIKILTGKITNENTTTDGTLKYADYLKEGFFRRYLFPTTVSSYHNKYANKSNPIYKKIFEKDWIKPKTKFKMLSGVDKRWLTIYTTLSWTNNIIFDLPGIGPQTGKDIYSYVKTVVNHGGSAILIDYNDEFKNDCTTFVEAQYLAQTIQSA